VYLRINILVFNPLKFQCEYLWQIQLFCSCSIFWMHLLLSKSEIQSCNFNSWLLSEFLGANIRKPLSYERSDLAVSINSKCFEMVPAFCCLTDVLFLTLVGFLMHIDGNVTVCASCQLIRESENHRLIYFGKDL